MDRRGSQRGGHWLAAGGCLWLLARGRKFPKLLWQTSGSDDSPSTPTQPQPSAITHLERNHPHQSLSTPHPIHTQTSTNRHNGFHRSRERCWPLHAQQLAGHPLLHHRVCLPSYSKRKRKLKLKLSTLLFPFHPIPIPPLRAPPLYGEAPWSVFLSSLETCA